MVVLYPPWLTDTAERRISPARSLTWRRTCRSSVRPASRRRRAQAAAGRNGPATIVVPSPVRPATVAVARAAILNSGSPTIPPPAETSTRGSRGRADPRCRLRRDEPGVEHRHPQRRHRREGLLQPGEPRVGVHQDRVQDAVGGDRRPLVVPGLVPPVADQDVPQAADHPGPPVGRRGDASSSGTSSNRKRLRPNGYSSTTTTAGRAACQRGEDEPAGGGRCACSQAHPPVVAVQLEARVVPERREVDHARRRPAPGSRPGAGRR